MMFRVKLEDLKWKPGWNLVESQIPTPEQAAIAALVIHSILGGKNPETEIERMVFSTAMEAALYLAETDPEFLRITQRAILDMYERHAEGLEFELAGILEN